MTATKPTILYIEDDAASRMLVERTLMSSGYAVVVAEDGLEGIDLARRIVPDLVLVDLNLPDLSGREVSTILRCDERFQTIPIVALTGLGWENRDTSIAAGINGYLMKPLELDELPRQIDYYLSGGQDMIDSDTLVEAQLAYIREIVARLEGRIRDLETANKQLANLDKMKDTFIQLTAHELRTPLTLVFGYSRLLADHPPLQKLMQYDENVRGLVRGMAEAIQRMYNIIEELLTMSRIMTNQIDLSPGPTNLRAIVRKVLQSYEQAFQERQLTVYFDESQWPTSMRSDDELLRLAISNLVSNAIKYTPDGGSIYLSAQVEGDFVRFSVRDTGIGINKGQQPHIFERFHTLRDVAFHTTSKTAFGGGGLGLGLAICKGIIEAHGGRLWVESPGHDPEKLPGSEFFVVLPLISPGKPKPTSKIKRLQ